MSLVVDPVLRGAGKIGLSPSEFDAILARAQAEGWSRLGLIAPKTEIIGMFEGWSGRLLKLGSEVEGTVDKLLSLTTLADLALVGIKVEDNDARAIALSFTGLNSLQLISCDISDEGFRVIASSLTDLKLLAVWGAKIGNNGARVIAVSLTGLTTLQLLSNGIGDDGVRAIAASLTNLASLTLRDNEIGNDGVRAIAASLDGVTSLDLSSNSIGADGARAIAASLTGLTSLNLGLNSISDDGARAIAASLTGLTSLNLWNNSIGDDGARAIAASLTGLTSLDLGNNSVGDDGARTIAASLTGLTSLYLRDNSIGDEGARAIASSLSGLTSLDLRRNSIGDDGARAIAASLAGLISLDLGNNRIGEDGARAILDAAAFHQDSRLRTLDLRDNGEMAGLLPKEVLESTDAQAILAAYRRFSAAQTAKVPLNELKLLVVGNEAVGKTSLLRYLIDGTPRDPAETRTPGIVQHEKIQVQAWSPDECQVQLNIWDFGGQEMLRGTHRFFLTERSLYLLVLEDRRQDDRSIYDWMKTIRNRGGESPIIVVINKSDNGKQDYRPDEQGLREEYANIVTFVRTSCNDDAWAANSIETLRRELVRVVMNDTRLRHVLDGIPANWLQIKHTVSALAHNRAILTHADFVGLCRNPGEGEEPVANEDEQRALLQLLHQLGTIVAHGLPRDASAARREVSLLEPNWLTDAVYTIVDRARMVEQNGEFLRQQLQGWLDPDRYPSQRHEFVLDMMQDPDVGLCFPLPSAHNERYLVPEALPPNRPYLGNRTDDVLRFRYAYGYLPPGLIPRLIVQSNRNMRPELPRWRSGVILATRECEVLVIADPDQRRVDVEVSGPAALRRAALNVVLNDLEAVHALNPEAEPLPLVPLPEQPDQQVRYAHLLELERRYGADHSFLPEGATREYTVRELLEGVRIGPGVAPPLRDPGVPKTVASWVPAVMLCAIVIAALISLIMLRDDWPVAVLVVLVLLLVPVIWAFLRGGGQLNGEQLLSVYKEGTLSVIRGLAMAAPQQADATDARDMAQPAPIARRRRQRSSAGAKTTATKRVTNRS